MIIIEALTWESQPNKSKCMIVHAEHGGNYDEEAIEQAKLMAFVHIVYELTGILISNFHYSDITNGLSNLRKSKVTVKIPGITFAFAEKEIGKYDNGEPILADYIDSADFKGFVYLKSHDCTDHEQTLINLQLTSRENLVDELFAIKITGKIHSYLTL